MDSCFSSYFVALRNEQTGEYAELTLISDHPDNAQEKALHHMFKEFGWRKAVAQPAVARGTAR